MVVIEEYDSWTHNSTTVQLFHQKSSVRANMALTSLLRAQYSLFVLHASYLTFEIQLLSYGQFLAVAAYSDIGKACGETAKRVDGNCGDQMVI